MTVPGRVRFLIGADLQEKAFQSPFSVSPKEREHWIGVPSFFLRERERFSLGICASEFLVPLPLDFQECMRISLSSRPSEKKSVSVW